MSKTLSALSGLSPWAKHHSPPHERCDLLLLNASNYFRVPIYPHAFVQVTTLARKHRLTVRRHDFLFDEPQSWQRIVDELVRSHRPRMIGVHLRQLDSLIIENYRGPRDDYRPAEATRFLIEQIRSVTKTPVVAGGFGFTSRARDVVEFLDVDYGVQGDADPFLESFERILAREDLAGVANLIYREGDGYRFNERAFFGPSSTPEYDEEICDEIRRFERKAMKSVPDRRFTVSAHAMFTVAVEVARGCPFKCYFCSEPAVKGTTLRTRDLDVVFEDVEFLMKQGFRAIWFVCSEANINGPGLLEELGRRMLKLRERFTFPRPPVWATYFLPKGLSRETMRLLDSSGMSWAWNEAQSLDDKNLRATEVPYSVSSGSRFFGDFIAHTDELLLEALKPLLTERSPAAKKLQLTGGTAFPPGLTTEELCLMKLLGFYQRAQDEHVVFRALGLVGDTPGLAYLQYQLWRYAMAAVTHRFTFGTFLGNIFTTAETIRSTIATFERNGFHKQYYGSMSIPATRAFPQIDERHSNHQPISFPKHSLLGRRSAKVDPTFYVNEVTRVFASFDQFIKFNQYVCDTFLSRGHLLQKPWNRFLGESTTPKALAGWVEDSLARGPEIPILRIDDPRLAPVTTPLKAMLRRPVTARRLEPLFDVANPAMPRVTDTTRATLLPFAVVELVYANHRKDLVPALDYLSIPHDGLGEVTVSEYQLMRILSERYESVTALLDDVVSSQGFAASSVELFCLRKLLVHNNVVLRPDYSQVLFDRP